MKCSKCGKELIDGAKFCTGCGTSVADMEIANESVNTEEKTENIITTVKASEENTSEKPVKPNKKSDKKKSAIAPWMVIVIVISIIAIIAAVVIGLIALDIIDIPGFSSGKSSAEDINYDEEDEDDNDSEDEKEDNSKADGTVEDASTDVAVSEEVASDIDDALAMEDDSEADVEKTEASGESGKLAKVEKVETKKPLYTEEELLKLAEIYYICNGGMVRDDKRVLSIDSIEDNIYTIHVYDEMEDHVATLDWYYVDITTGKGEDLLEKEVDFTQYEGYELEEILADYYVIPDSDSRKISESDLDGLTEEQIKIARNEIYARHGRIFRNQELQNYFDSKSWYCGVYQPDEFKDAWLNEYENYNKDFIAKYEKKKGYNQ